MGDNPTILVDVPGIARWDPQGDPIERRRQPSEYTPPSRQRVAEVVQDCELAIRPRRGESPVGVLLRDASEKLYKGAVNSSDKSIFPHALLAEVLTQDRVLSSLSFKSPNEKILGYSGNDCLKRICGDVKSDRLGPFARVFAVLLLCDSPQDVFLFFDHNLCDKDYPFEITNDDSIRPKSGGNAKLGLKLIQGKHITSNELDWRKLVYDSFTNYQLAVFLPSFSDESDKASHQEFTADTIMPWHECILEQMSGNTSYTTDSTSGGAGAIRGGHGSVRRVIIHDGHYSFRGIPQPSRLPGSQQMIQAFAVKKLNAAANKTMFDKEVAMLRELGGKQVNTVRLLATFCQGGTYSLLFPWAECDLLAYWYRDLGHNGMSAPLVLWVTHECHGLVSALNWIHNPGTGVSLGPRGQVFGRHGDIKPENILWYKEKGDGPHPLASGHLVFSDFGLSDLNHKDSRSGIYNKGILCTTTYAPPESILEDNRISRAIDVWSLGCVFLEFVTWLVGGPSAVREFQMKRLAPHLGSETKRDVFWELVQFPSSEPETTQPEYGARVKKQVVDWMKYLSNQPRATQFVHDFLRIIETHMLVIKVGDEVGNRARAESLKTKFDELKRNCETDQSYYTAKADQPMENFLAPRPEALSRHLSMAARNAISRGSVAIPPFVGQ